MQMINYIEAHNVSLIREEEEENNPTCMSISVTEISL